MAKLLVRPQAMVVELVNTSTNTSVFINVKATANKTASALTHCWIRSEPPRGSGWVRSQRDGRLSGYGPTRYREVVLTVSKQGSWILVACYNAQRATSNDTK